MPVYSKTTWVDGTAPAINASNLNKIEQGIADALRLDGSTTMSAQLVTIAGTAATPAIAPTGDSNTGIFFPAADTIAFGEGGTEVMRINSSGNVGIGTTSPSAELHVKHSGEIQRLETTTVRGSGGNYLTFYDPSGGKGAVGYTTASDQFRIINTMNELIALYTNDSARLIIEAAGTTRPALNNTYELGSSSFRWSTIYAQNALNTSDARLKTDVQESSLGLDFISALNPVQFRYIEGGNTVERVQTGTETVEITPAIPAQPEVLDEEGNVIQEATEEVPAVTEERPIYEEVVTPREGIRTHFGLLAQEVKAALPDGLDFAGWALADKEDAESTQFLGYAELIAPMIKAIQELKAEVDALKAQLAK